MISAELKTQARRLFYVNHFPVNAIAEALGIHRDTVMRALELKVADQRLAASELDRFEQKIKETLALYPKLHGSRIYIMLKDQGYTGSLRQLRRRVRSLRKPLLENFYEKPAFIPGEQAQVDWSHFGKLRVGRAERKLSAFVMTLSWSRRMFVCFTFDQKVETLLACHKKAFEAFGGIPRGILYDNMKTVVLERLGQSVRYHPALIEFCQHWLFTPSVCAPYHPQSKGRVERSIRYFRGAFFEGRPIAAIDVLNAECLAWCESEARERKWPDDPSRTVADAFVDEQKVLVPLPDPRPVPPRTLRTRADRYGFVHFDRNQYSVPAIAAWEVLTLCIYEHEIVILKGRDEITRHGRSFNAGEKVEIKAHRDEIRARKYPVRISHHVARLSEDMPELQQLMRQWIGFHLDTKALVSFLGKAVELHGSKVGSAIVKKALETRASRIEDLARYLHEFLQVAEPLPALPLRLPENPEVRDLSIKSHDLDIYDDL